MKITEIIKDAFLFPSKNSGRYSIYLLLSVLIALFALGGILTYVLGIIDAQNYLLGGIYLIISMLIAIIIFGYHIKIIKSGIDYDDNVPVFELFEDFMTGFDNFIVLIFYILIPTLIVGLVGLDTNIYGKTIALGKEVVLQAFNVYILGNSASIAVNAISNALNNLMGSLAVTIIAALVLFVIFGFLLCMAEGRLAKTGSLKEALNIFESIKDMTRIGLGKVIIVILLVIVLIVIIEIILTLILNKYPFLLSTLEIIITPYFILVTQRAIGLLYSDIT